MWSGGWPPARRSYSSATTHLIADVTGYVIDDQEPRPIGGSLVALDAPQRALDTRSGTPPVSAGAVRRVQLGGRYDIPTSGVVAVALNVTALNAAAPGYLTVYPCGDVPPNASNVNYVPARVTPNAAIVGLSNRGELCIFSETDVDVLIDVTGFFSTSSRVSYQPMNPLRVVDTRIGSALDSRPSARQKLVPGTVTPFRVLFSSIMVMNITVTEVESDGWLAVFPCDRPVPATSTLNFLAGDTVANATILRTSSSAEMCVYSTSAAHLVADIQGANSGWARFAAI